jgi:hypothetical protein
MTFHAAGSDQRTNGLRGTALAADDFAQIFRPHMEFEHGYLRAGSDIYAHVIGVINESSGDGFHQFFHWNPPEERFVAAILLSDLLQFDEAANGVTGTGADAQPIFDAIGIEFNFRGFLERIVCAYKLANAAITGPGSFNHYHAVKGAFLFANPCKANRQH